MPRRREQNSIAVELPYDTFDGSYHRTGVASLSNSAICEDETHPDFVGGRRDGDRGSAFDVSSVKYTASPAVIHHDMDRGRYEYSSLVPLSLLYQDTSLPPIGSAGELDLLAQGTTAIARTLPTAPSFSLYTALGEIRNDGVPDIPGLNFAKDRTRLARNSGSEYLNVEFGWAPLVSDLRKFAHTVRKSSQIIHQYHKGSDTRIRRRYNFPTVEASDFRQSGVAGSGAMIMYPGVDAYNGFGWGSVSETISHKTWFSGAFRYHVPVPSSTMDKIAGWESDANKLLGFEPTPEAVWNLAPWSWAIDWFTNTGDILANISALGSDGLVLEYGYIMDQLIRERHASAIVENQSGSLTTITKRLKRRVSTPYGFGFDMGSLSATQDAVLVALGLSHGRR